MSFLFFAGKNIQTNNLYGVTTEFIHRMGCKICPLAQIHSNRHPNMAPSGSDQPLIYMLGEAPGSDEDIKGEPFVGMAGSILRLRIPDEWLDYIRMSNVVRTRPPKNRPPVPLEVECCRPSVVADIEATKPPVVIGFGNIPLEWAIKQNRITLWNGRRLPVQIGSHTCWFYPIVHPSAVGRSRRKYEDGSQFEPRNIDQFGSEIEFSFALDLERVFNDVADGLPKPVVHTIKDALDGVEYVIGDNGWDDVNTIISFLDRAKELGEAGIDYETNMLRPFKHDAQILSVGVSTSEGTLSFPLSHPEHQFDDEQIQAIDDAWYEFLYDEGVRKISHVLQFEMEWSAYFYGPGCLYRGAWDDSAGAAFILDERQGGHSLEFQCLQYFGLNIKAISNTDRKNLAQTPLSDVLKYNGIDAKYHRLLFHAQLERLEAEGLMEVYEAHLRRVPAAVQMQIKGVPIDQGTVAKFIDEWSGKLADIEAKLSQLKDVNLYISKTAKSFNPGSPKWVKDVLSSIGIHIDNTKEELLAQVDHPFAKLMLKWREATKILSTYLWPISQDNTDNVLFDDGMVHPNYNLIVTRTWRTSADKPNVQNYPKQEHREIRSVVAGSEDLKIVPFDFAGIQARNIAMESQDPEMVRVFWERYDVHSDWLERIRRHWPRWMTKEEYADKDKRKNFRNIAKNGLVFPSFFGASAAKVASECKIPENVAMALQEEFWAKFPNVKDWHQWVKEFYREHGYVTGLSGFRRHAPISINELINAPIQADESLLVFNAAAKLCAMEDPRFVPNMEVHDDLTFIWPKKEIEKNAEIVVRTMLAIDYSWINVPLGVEMSVGNDWATVKGVAEYFSDELGLGPVRPGA